MQRIHLLGLLLVLLVFSGCSTYSAYNNTCGSANRAAPVVCIDSSGKANPDPVHVKQGQWVHFFVQSGDLSIEDVDGVLENTGQDGPQAWGRAKKDAPTGKHHYKVHLNGKTYDPDVMIDPAPSP